MKTSQELGKELHKKRGEMAEFIKANSENKEGKPQFHWNAIKTGDEKSASEVGIAEFNDRNAELEKMQDEFAQVRQLEEGAQKNADAIKSLEEVHRRGFSGAQNPDIEAQAQNVAPRNAVKSLGELFFESAEFKSNSGTSPDVLKQWAAEIPQGAMAVKADSYTTASNGTGVLPCDARTFRGVCFASRSAASTAFRSRHNH